MVTFRVFFVLALFACSSSDDTFVDVYFEADELSVSSAVSLRVLVLSADGTVQLDDTKLLSGLTLPSGVRVVPRDDESAEFEVVGRLVGSSGEVLQEARVRSRFVAGEARQLWLRFSGACDGQSCGAGETCRGGSCVGACATADAPPVSDKPTPTFACDAFDAGMDGGPDGGADAMIRDGGPDAPDGGPDTGPPPIPYVRQHAEGPFEMMGEGWWPVTGGSATIPGDGRTWLVMVSGQLTGINFPWTGLLRYSSQVEDGEPVELGYVEGNQNVIGPEIPGRLPAPFMHMAVLDRVSEETEIQVEISPERATASVLLQDLLIVAIPISEAYDYIDRSDISVQLFDGMSSEFGSVQDIDVPAGEHLVLVLGVGTGAPSANGLEFRVADGVSPHWPVRSSVGARSYMTIHGRQRQSLFLARHTMAAQRLTIEARSLRPACADEDPPCEAILDVLRVLVLDLAEFPGHQHADDTADLVELTNGTATWQPRSTLNTIPAGETDYLVIQSVMAYGGRATDDELTGRRGVRLSTGPIDARRQRVFDHQYDWREQRIAYPLADVFTTSDSFESTNEYSSPADNGEDIHSKESVIHVLPLPR